MSPAWDDGSALRRMFTMQLPAFVFRAARGYGSVHRSRIRSSVVSWPDNKKALAHQGFFMNLAIMSLLHFKHFLGSGLIDQCPDFLHL
jgi:hypothetical protein